MTMMVNKANYKIGAHEKEKEEAGNHSSVSVHKLALGRLQDRGCSE